MNKLLKSFIFIIFITNVNCVFSQEKSLDEMITETSQELKEYINNKYKNNKIMKQCTLPSGSILFFDYLKLPILSIGKIVKSTTDKGYEGNDYFFNVTYINGIVITIVNETYDEAKKDRDYLLNFFTPYI